MKRGTCSRTSKAGVTSRTVRLQITRLIEQYLGLARSPSRTNPRLQSSAGLIAGS